MRRTRVLVADSLSIFRAGVHELLSANSDFEVVEAADLSEVLLAVADDCPDVALIDLDLLPSGGLEAVAQLSERCSCHTIVWSYEPSRESVLDAIRAGADGYLEKTISPGGLVRALRGIELGEAPFSRHVVALMVEALHGREKRREALARASILSAREREVLDLVSRGARNREIAEELAISEFTVKRHMQNILKKLGLPSRRAAATLYGAAFGNGSDRMQTPIGGAA
jgi:DNA-binding NarL/FixJ family response regulator